MNLLPILPVLIPLCAAATSMIAWRSRRLHRLLAAAGALANLGAALALLAAVDREGILVLRMGNWPAPFGITFVADLLAAILVTVAAIVGTAVAFYSLGSMDPDRESFGYYPLLHILLMGVSGAFLSGDIFNLYVWFEVMLIASFVLLSLGGEQHQMEGAIKYVTLNLVSSALFLAAVGILYGTAGTLNFADLAVKLREVENPGLLNALAMLFLVAFGIKAAIFPLFFWLPASYHTPPVAVSAILAGLLTKVGVYALIRVFTLLFVQDPAYTHGIILVLAGFTMVTGVLGAAAQDDFRRILSFHIVSQIGYMIMGLGLFSPLALAGSIFYMVHHIIVKTNLFLISGIVHRERGRFSLGDLGGLYRDRPALAALFLVPAFSLAGVPPLSGFFAKLALVQAGLDLQSYPIVAVALIVGLLTLFSMTKIWGEAFWRPATLPEPKQGGGERAAATLYLPVVALAALTIAIGLWAEPLFSLAQQAAGQLTDPAEYVRAVLGGNP
ncbi:MAG: Na+/H+ antiporter subunit D [Deltaproteobacteria bacterium]|nr:Na+/H+ antiporter subunit D [Deltaproteobacteria bacterium]